MPLRTAPWEKPDFRTYQKQATPNPWLNTKVHQRIQDFYRRSSQKFLLGHFEFEKDTVWEPLRMLGSGSYGKVGLWVKRAPDQEVVDEVALKESARLEWMDVSTAHVGLAREAVLQSQINEVMCKNIVHLRRYKYFPASMSNYLLKKGASSENGKYRQYLEYCPHQSLDTLAIRYRAFDQYLPEAFLWYVFHSLANAVCAMDQGPDRNFVTGTKYDASWGLLHLDLKPGNVFLGHVDEATSTNFSTSSAYPVIKVSDFGLSEMTGPDDDNNPEYFWWTCTRPYQPPEHHTEPEDSRFIYGSTWIVPPNGSGLPRSAGQRAEDRFAKDPGFRFGKEHNVWGVGKCMYDLIKLAQPDDYYDSNVLTEEAYNNLGQHAIHPISITQDGVEIYSQKLRALIYECLRPDMTLRPDPEELRKSTLTGLQNAERDTIKQETQRKQGVIPTHKVYFAKNEINHMPQGSARFQPRSWEWNDMMNKETLDLDWGILRPPKAKWRAHYNARSSLGTNRSIYWLTNIRETGDNEWKGDEIELDTNGKIVFVRQSSSVQTTMNFPRIPTAATEPQNKRMRSDAANNSTQRPTKVAKTSRPPPLTQRTLPFTASNNTISRLPKIVRTSPSPPTPQKPLHIAVPSNSSPRRATFKKTLPPPSAIQPTTCPHKDSDEWILPLDKNFAGCKNIAHRLRKVFPTTVADDLILHAVRYNGTDKEAREDLEWVLEAGDLPADTGLTGNEKILMQEMGRWVPRATERQRWWTLSKYLYMGKVGEKGLEVQKAAEDCREFFK